MGEGAKTSAVGGNPFCLKPPPPLSWKDYSNDYLTNFGLKSGTGSARPLAEGWMDLYTPFR